MSPQPSHLNINQQQGKKYKWKAECIWCLTPYDKDLSDALQPHNFCGLRCETEYNYTT